MDQTYFNDNWLMNKDFKSWVERLKVNTKAYCKICRKTIRLSNMDSGALASHSAGKKHPNRVTPPISVFF